MKIVVCIKQVPRVEELRFDSAKKTLIREGVHNEINPFDRRALTFATALKTKYGGETAVMTMGPPQAKEALLEAMAMGADRSLHLLDRAFAGSDTLATARALAAAIRQEAPIDLVLCGKYSVDAETGHIGPEVAELLNLPHVSGAIKVELGTSSGPVVVEAETDYGVQTVETRLPLLITTAERLIKPYSPKPEEVENAKGKPYRVVQAKELGQDSLFGVKGSPTSVSEIYSIETKRKCELIQGATLTEKAQKLAGILTTEGLFTGRRDEKAARFVPEESRKITGNTPFWVVTEIVQGQIRPITYELLGKGLELATKLESQLCAIVFGEQTADQIQSLITHGADEVYVLKNERLVQYSNDAYADALAQTIAKYKPFAVIGGSTSFGRDVMPRVAARLGLGMTSDCIGLELGGQQQLIQLKPAFGGNIVAPINSKTLPQMATIRPGMLTPSEANHSRKGEVVDVRLTGIKPVSHVVKEEFRSDRDALRLDNAEVIVAVGAGVGAPQNLSSINQLASILGSPIAATRKVVDLGWLPSQLQVGLTGKSVAPKLYIAIAIRGAFNHMVGVGRANTVVAINNDPNAPIFKNCDYGVIGDYAEIVPALNEELSKAKARVAGNNRPRA